MQLNHKFARSPFILFYQHCSWKTTNSIILSMHTLAVKFKIVYSLDSRKHTKIHGVQLKILILDTCTCDPENRSFLLISIL